MANGLYSNVMYAFQDVLGYESDTIASLRRFVLFNVLLYVPHFLSAGVGADAPTNDLNLYKKLSQFRAIDSELADTALNVMRRHFWYLTEEVVIFSLFSNKVTEDEKSRIAARLLTIADPVDFPAEKPDFPDVLDTTQLVDLVGSNSWFIFHRLKLDSDWLKENVGDVCQNCQDHK